MAKHPLRQFEWLRDLPFLHGVHSPSDGSPKADVVFVHGLNPLSHEFHPYTTWTDAKSSTFWPVDLLAASVPSGRIWIYGYNSHVAFDVQEATVKDHANVLLDRLVRKRKLDPRRLPVIFIAHNLGGLVVKQALLNAHDNPTYQEIEENTKGLVFFGTPHRGSEKGQLGSVAVGIAKFLSGEKANNNLLSTLQSNSLFTVEASDRFRHQLEQYQVVSFFETKPTSIRRLGLLSKHLSAIVVDRRSATLGLPGHRELQLSCNDDHSNMCKISGRGSKFEGIVEPIIDLISSVAPSLSGSTVEFHASFVRDDPNPQTQTADGDQGDERLTILGDAEQAPASALEAAPANIVSRWDVSLPALKRPVRQSRYLTSPVSRFDSDIRRHFGGRQSQEINSVVLKVNEFETFRTQVSELLQSVRSHPDWTTALDSRLRHLLQRESQLAKILDNESA